MLALALAVLTALGLPDPAPEPFPNRLDGVALAPADTTPRVRLSPTFSPLAVYSPSFGFGVEGGFVAENLGWPGSEVGAGLRLSQFYQRADLTLLTGDPYGRRAFGAGAVTAEQSTRRRYYGLGPRTAEANRLNLDYGSVTADARAGVYPLGHTGLLAQPGLRLTWDRLRDVTENREGALARLDEASREAITSATDEDRWGVSLGLDLSSDRRNSRFLPSSGAFGRVEGRRFYALDGSGLRFNRATAQGSVFVPAGRAVLIGEGTAALTRADGGQAVPFYYLPTLDELVVPAYQDRFVGRDVVVLGLGGRAPVFRLRGVFGVDAYAMAYLAGAYEDVFAEITPAVSFGAEPLARDGGRAAFRPSVAVGGQVVNLARERVVIGGVVGVSPDGFALVALGLGYDLRAPRLAFR